MTILTATGLTKSYGPHHVLEGLDLSIHQGERVGLVGANGSGKSTLARILAGEETSDSGEIAVRREARVMYLAQVPQLDPARSALDVFAGMAICPSMLSPTSGESVVVRRIRPCASVSSSVTGTRASVGPCGASTSRSTIALTARISPGRTTASETSCKSCAMRTRSLDHNKNTDTHAKSPAKMRKTRRMAPGAAPSGPLCSSASVDKLKIVA